MNRTCSSILLGTFLVAAVAAVAAPARAQEGIVYGNYDQTYPDYFSFYGTVGIGGTGTKDVANGVDLSVTDVVFGLGGRSLVFDPIAISVDWAFASASLSAEPLTSLGFFGNSVSESAFLVGNPMIAGHFLLDVGLGALDIGFGFTLPFASDVTVAEAATLAGGTKIYGLAVAYAMGGAWNPWTWLPSQMSLVVPARFTTDLEIVRVTADGALAVSIETGDVVSAVRDDVELFLQLGGQAGLVLGPAELGARLQFVSVLTQLDVDVTQVSGGPYARFTIGPAFLSAYLNMNFDDPYGVSFDDGGFWGVMVSGGASF
ncbi:MAG: hypothetical protein R3A78_04265 [Polyangiales bacterium]|nr:hypothetical protein [Myxococcales bacterium]